MWNTQFENRGPAPDFYSAVSNSNGLRSVAREGGVMKRGYHGWTKTVVRWPNRISNGINVYPLVGLALTLLVIFMTIQPMVTHSFVDLPRSWYASPMPRGAREDAQIVSVARDGRIFYGNTLIAAYELSDRIREGIKNGADQKIYIRADMRAKYGDVKYVLGEIAKTGIQNVCFFAEKVSP
jgi:biopolymer transport protein TolR